MIRKMKKCSAVAWFICACAAIAIAPAPATAQATETVLHNFRNNLPKGGNPGSIIRDAVGNLYGTASGGLYGAGVVFKLDTTGRETVLYAFTGGVDGGFPSSLIGDPAGNLYGIVGVANAGAVFTLDPAGHESVFYSFASGVNVNGGLTRDAAGNLYGTTYNGGAANAGMVFKLDPTGQETVLYTFTGGADGGNPNGGLARDSAGNLYGTAGAVVYKLDPAGHKTVLYTFSYYVQPALSNLVRDSAGNLYGTAYDVYFYSSSPSVVFKVDPSGNETDLYGFQCFYPECTVSLNGVIRDSAGNLYGTIVYPGEIFKVDPAGHETVLYSFTGGVDGGLPSGVIRDQAGNLYGTTSQGGSAGLGVVYELDATGQEKVLYSFPRGTDGTGPNGLTGDTAGNLYGTTNAGGPANAGVVYKLDAEARETVLYSFTGGAGGSGPSGLIRDSAGNLYGTAQGGASGGGAVFKLDATGHETEIYSFTGLADGGSPGGVIRDPAGNLYGTTYYGGIVTANCPFGCGVVYKINATGQETVLYRFKGGTDGGNPSSGLIADSAGHLYGTTYNGGASGRGAVYKLDATGHETVLYSFAVGAGGAGPSSGVIRDSAGNLYGTTQYGGSANSGVVYKLDMAGQYTVLYTLTCCGPPSAPNSGLIGDSAGNLYGTTSVGGSAHAGVVYKLDAAGQYSVIYTFPGGADGYCPCGVIRDDTTGIFYGTTSSGGRAGNGTVFKIKP
jgi:uncharacterized repeat protein (TIGR03803 family)